MQAALAHAMESQIAFSWIKSHKVQRGVYLTWSQEYFATYLMH